MYTIINKIPIPIAGLMLASAAAGNLVLSYGDIYRNFFGILSAVIMFILIIKVFVMPKSLAEGFENPVVAGVMPTFSMGMMILSTYIKPYFSPAAYCIWLLGLTIHAVLMFYFTKKYILNFNIKKVFPSYFIVYVGIVCGSVTAPVFGLARWGQFIFWLGFASYLILLPLIIYRVMVIKGIPEPAVPTIAIFAAPASLCLAGYLNSFQGKNMAMVVFLSLLSLIMYISVMLCIPKILKLKFYPSCSALTFPFVITAVAIKGTYAFLAKTGEVYPLFMYLTKFLELWAITMVLYVLVRYAVFILSEPDGRRL
ncbi:TDT family transporter [Thermosediminibacter litoriperuensis]|uniref:Exfoliative toxin A/B n=1 Tax=Thermosediminibacter litoriperuensis TaxID=291989 RepID=A0A5S5AXF1_9FIRM|nr:TDT family transporter [Thermosediminibacter litoriperuensis]TYP58544.1 exfoliative toxin A/B [Thermosediminibacter litoriperuensis]